MGSGRSKAGRQARARLFGIHPTRRKRNSDALHSGTEPVLGGPWRALTPIILPTKKPKPSVGKDAPRLAILPHPVSSPLGPRHGGPSS